MPNHQVLYKVDRLPVLQNRVFDTVEEAIHCNTGDLVLVQDDNSGLIYNRAFDPALMTYDEHYDNEQSHSAIFQDHLSDVTGIIQRHFQQEPIIEIGCGKGYFLEQLSQLGFDIRGCDPSYTGTNPAIIPKHFQPNLELNAPNILLRHVLEHIPDPVAFLHNVRDSNNGKGKIYIEVPCLQWICDHHAFFDFFYEHVNYFLLGDFSRMFRTVYESGHLFGGQYLYVVADLATVQQPNPSSAEPFLFPKDFLTSIHQYQNRIQNRKSVIWGGASKGVLFALLMKRQGCNFDCAIDINPNKQQKYLPCTGLQIISPDQAVQLLPEDTDIYVMNSNYLDEIKAQSQNKFNYITVEHGSI